MREIGERIETGSQIGASIEISSQESPSNLWKSFRFANPALRGSSPMHST